MKNIYKIALFTITIILLTGCSQKSKPDLALVNKYDTIVKPVQPNETRINVIRKNTMLGAGVLTYIECSNKIYSLSSGSSMTCTTTEDINTINIMINAGSIIPQYIFTSVIPIDDRLNEEIFFYIEPLEPIKRIDANYGKTLMVDFNKFVKGKEENLLNYDASTFSLLNPDLFLLMMNPNNIDNYIQSKDKYYENFKKLVNQQYEEEQVNSKSNNINLSEDSIKNDISEKIIKNMNSYELNNYRFDKTLMKVDKNNQDLSSDESKIILFRKADNGSSYLGIWSQDKFIGDLGVESFIDYRTKDSKLTLHSYYHNWRTMEIPLEKGKTYYINVDFDLGWNENTIEFSQVTENIFNQSQDKLSKITLDDNKITLHLKKRIEKGLKTIKEKFGRN